MFDTWNYRGSSDDDVLARRFPDFIDSTIDFASFQIAISVRAVLCLNIKLLKLPDSKHIRFLFSHFFGIIYDDHCVSMKIL